MMTAGHLSGKPSADISSIWIFPRPTYLSVKDKRFIADLMPRCPIYIPLLPPEAQDVIGQVHPSTRPALRMLESEGFRSSGMVDIFEAGPIVMAYVDDIRVVAESLKAPLGGVTDESIDSSDYIVANPREDFRACLGSVEILSDSGIGLKRPTAELLQLHPGDRVLFSPVKAGAAAK